MIEWPWPAPVDDGGAAHLTIGKPMPDILLPTTGGKTVTLAALGGRAIMFAYPWTGRPGVANPPGWDDIPGAHGSTSQVEAFRNLHSSFLSLDTEVLGLSTQSTEWQCELKARMRLPFEIVSDEGRALTQALRLPTFDAGGEVYLRRLSLLIEDGKIAAIFYPVHPPDAHARDVLAWLTDYVGYALEGRVNPR